MIRSIGLLALLLAAPDPATAETGERSPITAEDARVERILLAGRIERRESIGVGVTLPERVWLTLEGASLSAAFKTADIRERGISRLQDRSTEINFTDRYQYERAAYLLARELGLGWVPVAVEREIRGRKGALVQWIENSFSESERARRRLVPPDVPAWQRQLAVMRLFDALIRNVDRNPGNILYSERDWSVHLIDHTRAFRMDETLVDAFAEHPARLGRNLLARLEALDEARLQRLLKHQISKRQIHTLCARRDLILAKIAEDRRVHGDDLVLYEE